MVLDPIPQSLPVHFFGSRPQPPTSPIESIRGHLCSGYCATSQGCSTGFTGVLDWETHDSFHWNCTPAKSARSRNSNSSVRVQVELKSQFEFVSRDTEKLEFLDLVILGVSNWSGNCYVMSARPAYSFRVTPTAFEPVSFWCLFWKNAL